MGPHPGGVLRSPHAAPGPLRRGRPGRPPASEREPTAHL